MGLIGISIKKPLMMIMLIVAVVLFGINSLMRMPVDLMPEMDLPYITVQALYIGAGPEEIENSVIKPIEEEMTTISGLKNMTSYCMEGVGFIVLEFDVDVDADLAAIDVKDKTDAILYQLPDDLQKPVIGKFDPNDQPILELALTGPATPEKLRLMADKQIKEQIARINGVGKIDVVGGREREIHVNLHKEKLDAHGLSIFQVFPVISAQTANFPAGHVTGNIKEYTVRVQGEFESIDDIANLKIPGYTGNIALSEIADVKDTYKEVREMARLNGKEAVGISILKRPDANTVEVSNDIQKQIEKINKGLRGGFKVIETSDNSAFIKNSVSDSYSSMAIGIVLTALVLLIFLFDWKLALIAAITMPVSVVMAFVGMEIMGFTLNIVTLMALSISVGILVANSIVVLENIVRYRDMGRPVTEAAQTGTAQILVAVLASTLTNLAVFIPIASTGGITGNVFRALGLTIVFATVASLFLSFTLTPLMSSRMLKPLSTDKDKKITLMDRLMEGFGLWYRSQLTAILSSRMKMAAAIVLTIALFFGTMIFIAPNIGSEFFPQSDQGYIQIDLEMPPGTPLQVTNERVRTVEKRVAEMKELRTVSTSIGGEGLSGGIEVAQLMARLVEDRSRTSKEIIEELRPRLTDLPDAKIILSERKSMGGPSQADIEVEVTGIHMDEILDLADTVQTIMAGVDGLVDINMSYKGVKPEIKLIPDRDRMEHYGLNPNIGMATTVQMLGGVLRFSMTGTEDAVYRENNEDYPIRVQIDPGDRNSIDDVENLTVMTPRGAVPVKSLVDVKIAGGASSITRKNRQRMVTVMANVASGTSGKKVSQLEKLFAGIPLKEGYRIGFGSSQEMMSESFGQLAMAAFLAVILTYMVLVGILESFSMALVIWLTLPLGLIGVIWALYLTGNSLSMISNMSIIMLVGVVVNNAILMIDYARQERREKGIDAKSAIIDAAGTKLRAIVMMNLAIIFAMLPQALALGSGGEIRAPFAITAIGGIIVSTVLTLFVIPVLYTITARKQITREQAEVGKEKD